MKLRIDEDAAPGSSDLIVGNFGDSLRQFKILFWFLRNFFLIEKKLEKINFDQKIIKNTLKLP